MTFLGGIFLGAAILAMGVILGWVLHDSVSRTVADTPREVAREALQSLSALAAKALVLRGLHPHIADPKTFTSQGISHEERETIETAAVDIDEETSETEDDMRRQLDALLAGNKRSTA